MAQPATGSRREFLATVGMAVAGCLWGRTNTFAANPGSKTRPNVLFIAVDDLRPQLGCYGHRRMLSPHLDKLAAEGTLFERSYCQVPVCGASRASLLSGLRPTPKRFRTWMARADEQAPGIVTLPEHFRQHGYHTVSLGKVFHEKLDNAQAWSEEPWRADPCFAVWRKEASLGVVAQRENGRGPAFEDADVPDTGYPDGVNAERAIADLHRLQSRTEPFFLAVGFEKPHLPFNCPKKYWDRYAREDIDLADNPFRPKDAPDAALHTWGELRAYADIPAKGPLDDELARSLVHGYYACVSYVDAQIGKVLDELDRLGLRDNTIVVLWGDHGWQLGEHSLWCKHCNFETSLHAPLLFRVPGTAPGQRVGALTQFLDIYPTLVELCGLPAPAHLHGSSLAPLLRDPAAKTHEAVFSRFHNGDSVRTDRYLYTEWHDAKGKRYARMLYDHQKDPCENVNIAEKPQQKAVVERLSRLLANHMAQAD